MLLCMALDRSDEAMLSLMVHSYPDLDPDRIHGGTDMGRPGREYGLARMGTDRLVHGEGSLGATMGTAMGALGHSSGHVECACICSFFPISDTWIEYRDNIS